MTSKERQWLRLHMTPGLGRVGILALMKVFGSIEEILEAGPSAWTAHAKIRKSVLPPPSDDDPAFEHLCDRLEKLDVQVLTLWDEENYPPLLRAIYDPPALLYVRGNLPQQEAIAVVGSRRATETSRRVTREICTELASRGVTIVSGLARGVDSAAHEGALEGKGTTVGVLGCGIDRVYPPENARLFHRILEKGSILSEYPPGTPPAPGHFPGRNRIISGLCRGVLIVEAADESGSLITADFALEQGRELFAVPGAVYASGSSGVNRLLKTGAHPVTEARDILQVLWPQIPTREVREREDHFSKTLSRDALSIYNHLGEEPLHIDELVRKSRLTPMVVSAILLHLEILGGVEQLPGMRYLRRGRSPNFT